MAETISEAIERYEKTKRKLGELAKRGYEEAQRKQDEYYEGLGRLVEEHPIVSPRRGYGTSIDQ